METMRRAVIYSSRQEGLSAQLSAELQARTHDVRLSGWRRAEALFDAGYLAETVRQAVAVYPILQRSDVRAAWRLRGDSLNIDGKRLMREASSLDAPDVQQAALSILSQLDSHKVKHKGAAGLAAPLFS